MRKIINFFKKEKKKSNLSFFFNFSLYATPFPAKYNKAPKMRPQKLDNIELALRMVEEAGIKTNFLKHARKNLK